MTAISFSVRKLAQALLLAAGVSSNAASQSTSLADAAMRGDAALVRSLIRSGTPVNTAQRDGMTALHWAAYKGNVEIARLVIAARGSTAASTRIGALAPLHLAAREGHAELVKVLIDARADVHLRTAEGLTALHYAAMSGPETAVRLLIARGAEVDVSEPAWGHTPLMLAAASGRAAAVRALLKAGASTRHAARTLDVTASAAMDRQARQERNAVLAKLREEEGQKANAEWRPVAAQVQAAVRASLAVEKQAASDAAIANDATATAQEQARLAAQGGAGLDDDDPSYTGLLGPQGGHTALLLAVREGHAAVVRELLDGGADINQVSAGDRTSPLLMAAINGQYDVALLLLERGADPNLASDAGATPLYGVINKEWAPTSRTPQPAYHLQQKATYIDVVQALLAARADPNARLRRNLWYTTYNRDNLRVDFAGATPFFRAAYATDVEAMRLLLAAGADPAKATLKPAQRARRAAPENAAGPAPAAQPERVDPSGLPRVPDGGPGVYPIHAASGVGYGQGFAANDHRHVQRGWLPAVRFLVEELGADVNARDYNGFTPLHNAAARGDNEMIRYLVSKGADVRAVARNGMTTADMANGPVQRISPYPETVRLLES
ncbi:MAG: ankyrin repeat domain-containing protein, partial [Gemmatimonadota bacterium]